MRGQHKATYPENRHCSPSMREGICSYLDASLTSRTSNHGVNSPLSSWFVTRTSCAWGRLTRKLCLQPQHLGKGEGDEGVSRPITFHCIGFNTNNHDSILFKFLLEWQYYHLYQCQLLQLHKGAGTTAGSTSEGSVHTLQDWLMYRAHDSHVIGDDTVWMGFV